MGKGSKSSKVREKVFDSSATLENDRGHIVYLQGKQFKQKKAKKMPASFDDGGEEQVVKVGKPKPILCGSQGREVPDEVYRVIVDSDGSVAMRNFGEDNLRLLYRTFFSHYIILQRKYFKAKYMKKDELRDLVALLDPQTPKFNRDGRNFRKFPSVLEEDRLSRFFKDAVSRLPSLNTRTPPEQAVEAFRLLKKRRPFFESLVGSGLKNGRDTMVSLVSNRVKKREALNGANGEHTGLDDVDVRVECICEACWLDWSNTLYTRTLLQTGAIWVNNLYCCICMETDGFNSLELLHGEVFQGDVNPPHDWSARTDYLQRYHYRGRKVACVQAFRSYGVVDFVDGEDELDWACLRAHVKAFQNNTNTDEVQGDWDAWDDRSMEIVDDHGSYDIARLNGANGEYTNSDDVETNTSNVVKGNPNARARVAMAHIRKNHAAQHQKKVNNGRNDPDDMTRRPVGAPKTDPRAEDAPKIPLASPVSVAQVESTKVEYYITPDVATTRYTDLVYTQRGIFSLQELPPDYNFVMAGSHMDCVVGEEFPGSVVRLNGKGKSVCVKKVFSVEVLPRSKVGSGKADTDYAIVFMPLLSLLKKTFADMKTTTHGVDACLGIGRREFQHASYGSHGLPENILVDTCKYYTAICAISRQALYATKHLSSLLGVTRPEELDAATSRAYQTVNVSVTDSEPKRVVAVQCPLNSKFRMHEYATVTCHGGASLNEELKDDEAFGVLVEPMFPTRGDEECGKWYSTEICRVLGTGVEPFVQYGNTGHNMTAAMNRILKARDGEPFFTANQQAIILDDLANFESLPKSDKDLLHTLRISSINNVNSGTDVVPDVIVRVGEGQKHHYENYYDQDWEERRRFEEQTFGFYLSEKSTERAILEMRRVYKAYTHYCDPGIIRSTIDRLYTSSHWAYYKGFDMYLTYMEPIWARECNAEIPHVKKALRKAYVNGVLLHDDKDVLVQKLNACVKNELAKTGKAPRLFVSYEAGCMYANELPEMLKMGLDGVRAFEIGSMTLLLNVVAKPKSDTFEKVFSLIRESTRMSNTLCVTIYSDDTVYSGVIGDYNFCFNVDISACDSSNHYPIFYMIGKLLNAFHSERGTGLVAQCAKPIILTNPNSKKERFIIDVHSAFEGSGTVLTTVLNHLASILDATAVCSLLNDHIILGYPPVNDEEMSQIIGYGAYLAGHKVSIQSCSESGELVYEKVQFLKRSMFTTIDGRWTYAENFGATLRNLGRVEGDLTCAQVGMSGDDFNRLSWEERMDVFLSGVIKGKVHEPQSPIMEALRRRFCRDVTIPNLTSSYILSMEVTNRESDVISQESLFRRYGVSETEMGELVEALGLLKSGDRISSVAAAKFYQVDYDVSLIPEPAVPGAV